MGLEDFLLHEEKVEKKSRKSFAEKIKAFDFFLLVLTETTKSIEPLDGKEKSVGLFYLRLLHKIHVELNIVFTLVLRGHYLESWAVLRPAVEATCHIYQFSKNPEFNALAWARIEPYEKQHDKIYGKLFPRADADLKPLEQIYYNCCKYSSHSTAGTLIYRMRHATEGELTTFKFVDIGATGEESERHLNYLLKCTQDMLRIFNTVSKKLVHPKEYKPLKAAHEFAHKEIGKALNKKIIWFDPPAKDNKPDRVQH